MGNYVNIEYDFLDRTMKLVSQYDSILHRFEFNEQYNYTLLLNCLLGVIVMPKEKIYTIIPNPRITSDLKLEMGLSQSVINPHYKRLRDVIHALRNSIAHSSFEIISLTEDFLVDEIVFRNAKESGGDEIAKFKSNELLPFIRYYADWVKSNIIEYKK